MATEKVSVEQQERFANRFAGDSSDRVQLTGAQFLHELSVVRSDFAIFLDNAAEMHFEFAEVAELSLEAIHEHSRRDQFASQLFVEHSVLDCLLSSWPSTKSLLYGGEV